MLPYFECRNLPTQLSVMTDEPVKSRRTDSGHPEKSQKGFRRQINFVQGARGFSSQGVMTYGLRNPSRAQVMLMCLERWFGG